jgi:hypothetical protein
VSDFSGLNRVFLSYSTFGERTNPHAHDLPKGNELRLKYSESIGKQEGTSLEYWRLLEEEFCLFLLDPANDGIRSCDNCTLG